jgi:hypothetical protein
MYGSYCRSGHIEWAHGARIFLEPVCAEEMYFRHIKYLAYT